MTKVSVLVIALMHAMSVDAMTFQGVDDADSIIYLQRQSFVVWYHVERNIPIFVAWSLSHNDLGANRRPRSQTFLTDFGCPRPRAKSSDYTRSGYQRGHLCPSADRSANDASMRATFIMSNVAPMTPRLNQMSWAQAEEYARIVARGGHRCQMVAGSLMPDSVRQWLKLGHVAIPDSFFRACVVPDSPNLSVFWLMANDSVVRSERVTRVSRARFMQSLRSSQRVLFDSLITH